MRTSLLYTCRWYKNYAADLTSIKCCSISTLQFNAAYPKGGPNIQVLTFFIFNNIDAMVPSAGVVKTLWIDERGLNWELYEQAGIWLHSYVFIYVCVAHVYCMYVCVYANEGRCSFPPTRKSNLQRLRQVKCSDVLFKSRGHFSHLRCKLETWPYRSISLQLFLSPLLILASS